MLKNGVLKSVRFFFFFFQSEDLLTQFMLSMAPSLTEARSLPSQEEAR